MSTDLAAWLQDFVQSPEAMRSAVELLIVIVLAALPLRLWRADRLRATRRASAEANALAEIADYVCDLVIAVAEAPRDEVTVAEFIATFDRRQLVEAGLLLEAVSPQSLPSLLLLRPLFELRWAVEAAMDGVERLDAILADHRRAGWRDLRSELSGAAERAATASEAFRRFAANAPASAE